ncbi:heparanase [Rhinatrema bivittatum]|uniref:heparanase n=1 Tax=Rhinatrema bivittatum TaxID=194408 RepID=UPI001127D779|nr:heparanase [Rhinatrema bivittatum]
MAHVALGGLVLISGLLLLGGCSPSPKDAVELRADLRQPRGDLLNPQFLSLTIDANLVSDPRYVTFLGSTKLRTLAKGLSPAYLRFGGTKTDFLLFDPNKEPSIEEKLYWESQTNPGLCEQRHLPPAVEDNLRTSWPLQEQLILKEELQKKYKNTTISRSTVDLLYSFANCSGLYLIFGLNALLRKGNSQWDSSNAKLFLNYCASKQYNLSWELGNEPNSFRKKSGIYIDGSQLGQDFIQLHNLLRNYSCFRSSGLYGPDVGQPRKETQKLLKSFLKAGGKVINSVTWHHYYVNGRTASEKDFLSPDVLDALKLKIQNVFQIVNQTVPDRKVWLGETSSAYGGGSPGLSNTYVDGFMWLDKLGLSATLGIDIVMRQAFFGTGAYNLVDADLEPLPDYWLSLIYKKLVGSKVLTATVSGVNGRDDRKLRAYLHCTNSNHPKYRAGDVTLFVLNLHNDTRQLQLPSSLANKYVDAYLLLPAGKESLLSRSVQLNDHVLKMVDDKTLPTITEKPLSPSSFLNLPGFSYGFFVIKNAKATACI